MSLRLGCFLGGCLYCCGLGGLCSGSSLLGATATTGLLFGLLLLHHVLVEIYELDESALGSVYGYEWQGYNLLLAREALLYVLLQFSYSHLCALQPPLPPLDGFKPLVSDVQYDHHHAEKKQEADNGNHNGNVTGVVGTAQGSLLLKLVLVVKVAVVDRRGVLGPAPPFLAMAEFKQA